MTVFGASPRSRGDAQRVRARAAWLDLRDRLATVTPAAAGRAVLALAVIGTGAAVSVGTWPALLPFVVGGLIAWAALPMVDSLDRIMPRSLAAVASVLAIVVVAGTVIAVVVPTLASALLQLAQQIPGRDEIDGQVAAIVANLPQETRDLVAPILVTTASVAGDALGNTSVSLRDLIESAVQAAPQILSTILGLLVLPTWIVTVMTSNRRAHVALNARLAGWLRPDFWAVVRMANRAVRTFVRGYVTLAFMVGLLTYVGTLASPMLGGPEYGAALAIATFAGVVQLVPELGVILGFFPALLLLVIDPNRAAVYVAIYLIARVVGGNLLAGRLVRDSANLHRAIVIPGVVVLSQIGPLALLLSAPILAFGADFVRYAHGRLSEPPRPAGLMPGEKLPRTAPMGPARLPAVYRPAAAMKPRTAPR